MKDVRADESLSTSVEAVLREVARQVQEEVLRADDLRQRSRASRFRVLPRPAKSDDQPRSA
jgi:hypothetical protein